MKVFVVILFSCFTVYLPLVASDDEKSSKKNKKKRSRDDDDETWSPTGKLGNVGLRNSKVSRQHAKKKSVEKGLKEAASRPLKIKVNNSCINFKT